MEVFETNLSGVISIITPIHRDQRGFFVETYNQKLFSEHGLSFQFVQDNHSFSVESGTIRGLHYQLNPKAQTKLVRVLHGAIYDVVVDLRRMSPTYGQWESFVLSEENRMQLLVPRGCAHGYCTLAPDTQVVYKVDEYYSRENDRGILWNDNDLKIDWPTNNPILSEKDKANPAFCDAEHDF